jgi:glycosyltransferase involved in cell wall biosynthesis
MATVPVSIVIPAFNVAKWIDATLASVYRQTYPHDQLDIVVVEDGSSDRTEAIARASLDSTDIRHIVLRNPTPQGPSAARNRGWRHARGTWIQFLDADDLIEPDKIAMQSAVAQHAAPDVAAVFSPWGRLVQSGRDWTSEPSETAPAIGNDPLLDILRADNFLQLGCLLFERTWLERVSGFSDQFRLIEDVDLLMRIVVEGGRLQSVPSVRPLSWYRQREGSLSRESSAAFMDGCVRNAKFAEAYWRGRHQLTPSRVELLAGIYFAATRFYAEPDPERFRALTRDLYDLNPHFVPDRPSTLRLLTRWVGYSRAERCAVQYRRFKRALFKTAAPDAHASRA